MSKDYPVSFVVTDPKGSLALETGKLLKRCGYKIKIWNSIDFSQSMHFNPFEYLHSEVDILTFVNAFIANTSDPNKKGGDEFWTKAETMLYCALVGYIHYECRDEEKNINTLTRMITLIEVHEEDDSFKNQIDFLFDDLAEGVKKTDKDGNEITDEDGEPIWETEPQPDHFAVRQYAKYRLAAGLISSNGRLNRKSIFNGGHGVAAQRTDTTANG
jgi:type IV secretion system protein VirD4